MATRDVRPDTVIYATGYTQEFDFLDVASEYKTHGEMDINVAASGDESVGFIGFVRPGVGNSHGFLSSFLLGSHMKIIRCNPPNSRNASIFLDIVDKRSSPQTCSSATLPFARQGKCTN
jgi:hypothetical protein